jgi:dTDP-4-amino-4,6-dideoxygalactose transaminase
MTDIMAAIGLVQLERYQDLINRRKELYFFYLKYLNNKKIQIIPHNDSSFHLFMVKLTNFNEFDRNKVILTLSDFGISTNVHYKPLPLFTAYKNLGFDINDFPKAFSYYQNQISLPFHTLLTEEDILYVSEKLNEL